MKNTNLPIEFKKLLKKHKNFLNVQFFSKSEIRLHHRFNCEIIRFTAQQLEGKQYLKIHFVSPYAKFFNEVTQQESEYMPLSSVEFPYSTSEDFFYKMWEHGIIRREWYYIIFNRYPQTYCRVKHAVQTRLF